MMNTIITRYVKMMTGEENIGKYIELLEEFGNNTELLLQRMIKFNITFEDIEFIINTDCEFEYIDVFEWMCNGCSREDIVRICKEHNYNID